MLIVVGNECQPDQCCFLTLPPERLSLSKYTILIRATNCLISLTLIATKHVWVCLTAVQTNMKNGSFVVVLQIQLFKLIKSAFFLAHPDQRHHDTVRFKGPKQEMLTQVKHRENLQIHSR